MGSYCVAQVDFELVLLILCLTSADCMIVGMHQS